MVALRTARMPGQVWGLAAPGQSGPLFVTSYRGRDLLGTVLTALDVSGQVLWKREFEGHPGPPRVSSDTGNVWITHRTPGHDVVCEIDASGTVVQTIAPMCERSERLCAFAVLGQRVITAWLRVERGRLALAGRAPGLRGQIAFALGDELVLVSDTGLSTMNDGSGPCAGGGLHGNPVQAN